MSPFSFLLQTLSSMMSIVGYGWSQLSPTITLHALRIMIGMELSLLITCFSMGSLVIKDHHLHLNALQEGPLSYNNGLGLVPLLPPPGWTINLPPITKIIIFEHSTGFASEFYNFHFWWKVLPTKQVWWRIDLHLVHLKLSGTLTFEPFTCHQVHTDEAKRGNKWYKVM
jgi:hypothetical protein